MDETSSNPAKECVLKCSKPKQLFDLPSENAIRELWLYTLGLDKHDGNLSVCERHFSNTSPSETTIPDQNLPGNIVRKEYYDKLIENITSTKLLGKTNILKLIENESCLTKNAVNPHPKGVERNESSITVIKEPQPTHRYVRLGENESECGRIEEESKTTSTIMDTDPISEFMRLATNESPTTTMDVGSGSVSKCQEDERLACEDMKLDDDEAFSTLIEEDSQSNNSSNEMREERDFATTIIEESLRENLEPTEKELPTIIDDVQIEAPVPATIESQDVPPSADGSSLKPRPPPENLINDTSTFLLDYQLCIQGKYMCDVIEIPEYVVVITIPKAKEPRPAVLQDTIYLGPEKKKENLRSLLDIPPSISISRTISEKTRTNGTESYQTEEIDYVYYMGEDEIPRRDREVQADIEIKMKDSADQCDVELDVNMATIRDESKLPIHPSDFNKRECLVCGEILLNYLAQAKHFASHKNEVPTLCSYCGEKFANTQKLIVHEKYYHDGVMMKIKEVIRCPRLFCQKAFHSKKQLHDHIDEHIRNVGHKCYICHRTFTSSLQLFRHQRISKLCLKRKIWKQRMFFRRMLEC